MSTAAIANPPVFVSTDVAAEHNGRADASERAMIDAAKRDPSAYGPLYLRHYSAVLGYLYRRTGDMHASEDLAAQTFIAAWRALGHYRHTGAPFRAWLLRIATREAHRWLRRQRRLAEIERSAPARAFEGVQPGVSEEVRAALRTLTLAHQDVVALVYFESLTIEQAAGVLGVRPGTVKSRLSRAREKLADELARREVLS